MTSSGTGSKRSPVPPAEMPRHVPAGYPDSMVTGVRSRHHHPCQFAFAISRRRSPAVLPAPPGRWSCAQGRWSVARAPVTGWTDCDRGPQADAEERTRSVHRAIEIREKRRRVLSSRPAGITLALHPTSSVSDAPVAVHHAIGQWTRRTPRPARHRWSWARRITTYRTAVPAMSRPASRSRSVAERRWRRRVRRASRGGNPVAGPATTVRGRRVTRPSPWFAYGPANRRMTASRGRSGSQRTSRACTRASVPTR